jgi:hypothetical protein
VGVHFLRRVCEFGNCVGGYKSVCVASAAFVGQPLSITTLSGMSTISRLVSQHCPTETAGATLSMAPASSYCFRAKLVRSLIS